MPPTNSSVVVVVAAEDQTGAVLAQVNERLRQAGSEAQAISARSSEAYDGIARSADGMAHSIGRAGVDVRHSIGLVDNAIRGAHGQAMADIIRLYGQSGIVMDALPFAAVGAGFAVLAGLIFEGVQKIREWREEQEKLSRDLTGFDTASTTALNHVRDEIIRAQQQAAELRGNQLAALKDELQLIDHQSMDDLVRSFGELRRAADDTFKDLQGHWYMGDSGAAGATHALQEFQSKYDNLLAHGQNKEASDLLHGTLQSAQKILSIMEQVRDVGEHGSHAAHPMTQGELDAAWAQLRAAGVTGTDREIAAQRESVDVLSRQVEMEKELAQLEGIKKANATAKTNQEIKKQQRPDRFEGPGKMLEEDQANIGQTEAAERHRFQVAQQADDALIAQARNNSAIQLANLDAQYASMTAKDQAYFDRKRQIQNDASSAEERAIQSKMADVRAEEQTVEGQQREAELSGELIRLQTRLAEIATQRKVDEAAIAGEIARQQAESEKQLEQLDKSTQSADKAAARAGERYADAFFDPLLEGSRNFSAAMRKSMEDVTRDLANDSMHRLIAGFFGRDDGSGADAGGDETSTGGHTGILSKIGAIFGIHGGGGTMPKVPSAAGAVSPANMPGMRLGNSPNISVQIVNNGTPSQVTDVQAGQGQDPTQLVTSIVLDDLNRGGQMSQAFSGLAKLATLG